MKTWHAHLRRTVKLIEFTYEDCNAFFATAKEKRIKREHVTFWHQGYQQDINFTSVLKMQRRHVNM